MKPVTLLAELQNLDTLRDENTAARAALRTKMADASAVTSARAALDTTDKIDSDLKTKLRALELETGGLAEKLGQVSERLYSGRITNAKELAGLNQDEQMLQRRKAELEDQALSLMEQIETSDSELKTKHSAFEKISAQSAQQHNQSLAALQELEAAAVELGRKRDAVAAQLHAGASADL